MARVPTISTPFVAPDNSRQAYGRASAGPESLGGQEARAIGGMGQQIGQIGDQLGQLVLQQQDKENRARALDTTVQGDQQLAELAANYGSLQGQAAVEAFPQYQKDLVSTRETLLNGLTNPAQKLMVSEYLDRRMASFGIAGIEHRVQQQQAWSINSSKAAAEQSVNNAVASGGNFSAITSAISGGEQEAERIARMQGGGDLEASVARAGYRGSAYRTVIEGMAQSNPLQAQALFDSVRGTMDGQSAVATESFLKPKVLDARSDTIASQVMGGGDYASRVRGAESGTQGSSASNPNSTAQGNYQFTAPTWADMQKRHPELGLTDDGRRDGAQQQQAFDVFTQENKQALRSGTGHEPNNGETYLAHFLGAGDAVKVLNADPSTPISGLVDPDSISANKSVLAGKTAGDVQAWAQRKMGSSAPARTSDEMLSDAVRLTAGDPDLQRMTVSKVSSQINMMEAATATARTQLGKDIKELGTAAENGHQIVIPEERIRALVPDKADEVIGTLQAQQATGDIVQGLQFATPDQIATTRQGIKDGTSPFSASIDAGTGGDAETFNRRDAVLKSYDEATRRRQEAIKADPATYAVTDPTVRAAADTLQAQPTPENWAKYATATTALQDRIGVPPAERAVLTGPRRSQILGAISSMDPKTVADFMSGLQSNMGPDVWPEAFADLQRGKDGLPSQFVALGMIKDMSARTTLANVLQQEMTKPGTVRSSLADTAGKTIDTNVESSMAEFAGSFGVLAGGQAQAATLMQSTKMLAYGFASQGMSESAASNRAVAAIAGQYDVKVSNGRYNALAPVGFGNDTAAASDVVRSRLTAADLAVLPDRSGLYSAQDVGKAAENNAKGGLWVTSPGGDGWTLLGSDGAVVRRRNGQPVALTYDEARTMATTRADTGVTVGRFSMRTPIAEAKRDLLGPSLGPQDRNATSTFGDLQPGQENFQ